MRFILALLATLLSLPAAAQDALTGRTLFQIHCATCHGPGAKGDGLLSKAFAAPVADLTQLSAQYGGVFPTEYVVRRVDGSERLLSHGDPMPVYTLLFDGPSMVIDTPSGDEIAVPEALAHLAAWLETVQE